MFSTMLMVVKRFHLLLNMIAGASGRLDARGIRNQGAVSFLFQVLYE